MADNVTLNVGVGGDVAAADDIAGVKYQRLKITLGDDGVNDGDVSSANPMPVSAAALPLPSGAATDTKQDTGNASLASIDGKVPALGQALATASVPVVLTAAQVSTLTPPAAITGFATEATLDARTGSLTETAPADDTASSGINGRLQRIAQRITSLIAALGSPFQAGGSIGNTAFGATQSGTWTVQPGNTPNTVAWKVDGSAVTQPTKDAAASSATLSNVSSSASNVTLLAANASRRGAIFYNDSTQNAYVKLGATASATSFSYLLVPGQTLELPAPIYTGIVDGIWASANGSMRVSEIV